MDSLRNVLGEVWGDDSFAWSDKATVAQERKAGAFQEGFSTSYVSPAQRKYAVQTAKLADLTHIPQPGETVKIITQGGFSAIAFVHLLTSLFSDITATHLVSYNFGEAALIEVESLHAKGRLGTLHIVISQSIKFRMPHIYDRLSRMAEANRGGSLHVAAAWNHAKVMLVETASGNRFVVEGSGNFSENAFIEQYSFENCDRTHAFHKDWIENNVFRNINNHKNNFTL